MSRRAELYACVYVREFLMAEGVLQNQDGVIHVKAKRLVPLRAG
jgi:hypothetical protein